MIPTGERWGGFTDRHHIFRGRDAERVLDILSWMVRSPELERRMNPERALKAYWNEVGIVVSEFRRVMFTVHLEVDMTRWYHHSKRCAELPHLFVHYAREYDLAKVACGANARWLF